MAAAGIVSRVVASPATGGLLDPEGTLTSAAYRPGARLAAHVRARDGRCRFPGCHVAARFCDLDHVRPWPAGPTSADNLLTLCRRHHRTKQRAGWRVHLAADGLATWTDPTGRSRTTGPVDALHGAVLVSRAGEPSCAPARVGRPVVPDGPWSVAEFEAEHRLADHHRRGIASAARPAGGGPPCRLDLRRLEGGARPCAPLPVRHPRRRPRPRERDPGPPPF